jgi:hypothetical protein
VRKKAFGMPSNSMIEVGKTYKVFHWDIKPRNRADNPHWSVTGS